MTPTKVAVIGAGHLGQYHAAKYAASKHATLVGIADSSAERGALIAGKHGVPAVQDYRDLLGKVDAVSIAVPAAAHYAIAKDCLEAGLHVLVEKPIAVTLDEADRMIALARRNKRVLQVGHVERFNPAGAELLRQVKNPLFIECHRLAPFKPRGTDVSVLLDLMIHDLDLIAALAGADCVQVDAAGASVLSDSPDIVNARLRFANGCIANITSSRVSLKTERKLRIFSRDGYFSADLGKSEITIARKLAGDPPISIEQKKFTGDALETEIEEFLAAIREQRDPSVTGEAGRLALALSLEVGQKMFALGEQRKTWSMHAD